MPKGSFRIDAFKHGNSDRNFREAEEKEERSFNCQESLSHS